MQITYKNKVTLQSNPNIPDENKVTAEDMNEIKSVVNSNEEEQQDLTLSVQEIAQNVVNNSQEISNIKEEQITQNNRLSSLESDNTENKANIQENANNINQLSRRVQTNETNIASLQLESGNTLELSLNNTTYELTATLKNKAGTILSTSKVDFPVEQLVISVTYDSAKKELVITLKNGQITRVPIGSIINGLVNQSDFDALVQTVQKKADKTELQETNTNVTNLAGRVSNNENKIENIEQEQTTQNTNISTNATNIESLQEENDNLKKIVSQLPQVTGQGTEITLENTIEAPFTILDVEGNSTQDGTSSPDNEVPILSSGDNENLFDKDNAIISNVNLSSATTISGDSPSNRTLYLKINPNTTYTISKALGIVFTIGTTETMPTQGMNYSQCTRGENASSLVITTNATAQYLVVWFWTKTDLLTLEEMLNTIKVEKGNKATPYSPYGMGSINEKIQNKNLFDKNNAKNVDYYIEPTTGSKVTQMGCMMSDFILVKENTSYVRNKKNDSNGNTFFASLIFYDKNKNYISGLWLSDNTFTTPAGTRYINLFSTRNRTNDENEEFVQDFMVEPGTTATPYVPHEEQDYSIFVQQPFRSIGDVRDCFVKKSDGWYERHYIARKIFDGTEEWGQNGSTASTGQYVIATTDKKYGILNLLSNSFVTKQTSTENSIAGRAINRNIYITIDLSIVEFSVAKFKAYLAEKYASGKSVYVDYELEEPLDLPCTEEQIEVLENMPSTYKDFTIIQSEDETKAYLEVSGIYDLNKLITRTEVLESES